MSSIWRLSGSERRRDCGRVKVDMLICRAGLAQFTVSESEATRVQVAARNKQRNHTEERPARLDGRSDRHCPWRRASKGGGGDAARRRRLLITPSSEQLQWMRRWTVCRFCAPCAPSPVLDLAQAAVAASSRREPSTQDAHCDRKKWQWQWQWQSSDNCQRRSSHCTCMQLALISMRARERAPTHPTCSWSGGLYLWRSPIQK